MSEIPAGHGWMHQPHGPDPILTSDLPSIGGIEQPWMQHVLANDGVGGVGWAALSQSNFVSNSTSFGMDPALGGQYTVFAYADHNHGTPANPIPPVAFVSAYLVPKTYGPPVDTVAQTTAGFGTSYFAYVGKTLNAPTGVSVRLVITTPNSFVWSPPSTVLAYSEIGVFRGVSALGAPASVIRCGSVSIQTAAATSGVISATISVGSLAAGDDIWIGLGCGYETTGWGAGGVGQPFQVRGCVPDELQSGGFCVSAGKLSAMSTSIPTALTLAGSTIIAPWLVATAS